MSHHLESDERGIILPCPACGTANRIAYTKVSQQGRCGTCKADLPLIAAPVEMTSPAAFAALISQSTLPVVIDNEHIQSTGIHHYHVLLAKRSAKNKNRAAGNVRTFGAVYLLKE